MCSPLRLIVILQGQLISREREEESSKAVISENILLGMCFCLLQLMFGQPKFGLFRISHCEIGVRAIPKYGSTRQNIFFHILLEELLP